MDEKRYRQADAPLNPVGFGKPLMIEVKFDVRKIVEVNEPKVNFTTIYDCKKIQCFSL